MMDMKRQVKTLKVDQPLNLDHTLSCKQAFRWEKRGRWWYGVVEGTIVRLQSDGKILRFSSNDPTDSEGLVAKYFRLDDDVEEIYQTIRKDRHITTALEHCHGLRVLRQDPWECLASYICATYSNIPRIEKMISNLCQRFGTPLTLGPFKAYTFPTPKTLSKATLTELAECGLGYRAGFIKKAAETIFRSPTLLSRLKPLPYEEAVSALTAKDSEGKRLPGVGSKVADCVALYSLEKLDSFPVDVWVRRASWDFYADMMDARFSGGKGGMSPREYLMISSFGRRYFGSYAGYANLLLFYYRRMLNV